MDIRRYRTELVTEIRHVGSFSLNWRPSSNLYLPALQAAAGEWFVEQCMKVGPTPEAFAKLATDLQPKRVGVFDVRADFRAGGPGPDNADLYCLPVSWAEFLVMLSTRRSSVPPEEQFRVLAVTCLVTSAEGNLILSQRSRKVMTEHGAWSVTCAGYAEFSLVKGGESALPSVYAELEEEAGLTADMLEGKPVAIGLCEHPSGPSENPVWIEGLFTAQAKLTASEILEQAKGAKDGWEGKYYAFTKAQVLGMLESGARFHTPAVPNLVLALRISS